MILAQTSGDARAAGPASQDQSPVVYPPFSSPGMCGQCGYLFFDLVQVLSTAGLVGLCRLCRDPSRCRRGAA